MGVTRRRKFDLHVLWERNGKISPGQVVRKEEALAIASSRGERPQARGGAFSSTGGLLRRRSM